MERWLMVTRPWLGRWSCPRRARLLSIVLVVASGLVVSSPTLAAILNTKLNDRLALGGEVLAMQISPDGNYVVYLADHTVEGMLELYSVPAAGGEPVRLYSPLDGNYGPPVEFKISADGSQVVFRAEHPDYDFSHNLYSVPIAGGSPAQVNDDLPSVAHDIYDFRISPDSQRIIYRADVDTIDKIELLSAPIAGGSEVKLNGGLVSAGDVQEKYLISSDSSRVVYRADQDADNVYELYSVPIGGGAAAKLNAALVSGGDVQSHIDISPDRSTVVYSADQDTDNVFELYGVPITGGTPVKLSGTQSNVGVLGFAIAPDSSRVVYRADPEASTRYELFSVPIGGGAPLQIAAIPSGKHAEDDFQISPDSSTVVYRADKASYGVEELFSVPIGGGNSPKLSGTLASGGDVLSFQISADSSRVAYQADQDSNGVNELYGVPIGGGTVVKLNDALPSGGDVQDDYEISADSSYAIYRADQSADETFELFSVPLSGGAAVRLNEALRPEGDVSAFAPGPDGSQTFYVAGQETGCSQSVYIVPTGGGTPSRLDDSRVVVGDVVDQAISPDGSYVVYRADQRQDEVQELFSVPAGGGASTRLNGTLVAFGDVLGDYQIDPAGSRVLYRADQAIDGVNELFSVPIAGGTEMRLNPALSGARDVRRFQISPDSQRVVYSADEAADGDFQLFSVPITGGTAVALTDVLPPVDEIPYQITPDSNTVVFLAGFDQMYSVPIGGGTPVMLYDAEAQHVVLFACTPDSDGVVFLDQYAYGSDSLYYVPSGGGTVVRLDAPTNGVEPDISSDFQVSPDGNRVVYRGDQDTNGQYELYSVPTTGGTALKVNGALMSGGDVTGFQIRPDSATVVYRADQEIDDRYELYRVPMTGGDATKISYPLNPGDGIEDIFVMAPDGSRVFYLINQNANDYRDLYLFAASLVEPITYLLGYLYAPNNTSSPIEPEQFKVGADSRNLVYAGVAKPGEPIGLYSVPLAGGIPKRLDGPLTSGGEVDRLSFRVSHDSQTAVYRADQDTDEVFELYASTRLAAANLHLHKAVTPSPFAEPGQALSYTLIFGNSGEATASGVVISDTIPAELTGVTFDSSGVELVQVGGIPYRWQVEDLGPGASGTITITGVIRADVSAGTTIRNSASITTTAIEEDASDNRSEVTIKVILYHKIYLPTVLRD